MRNRQVCAARVVGYIRASTEEQQLGPAAQREALARWCTTNTAELVAVCQDIGASGGAPLDRRPGLIAALAALRQHGAGVLLVAKRDRLARDVIIAAMVERLAERDGAVIRSADGTGNGDGPEALLMRRIVNAFHEYERALIRARTRTALAVKRDRSERVSRQASYGHRLTGDDRVVPDASEQRTVALVRQLRADGLTLRAIAARLHEAGIRPRSGGQWHPQTVARIAAASPHAATR